MINEMEIKKQICEVGKRIYNRNMVAANDGNISVKLNDHEFLCTPTGVSKGFMQNTNNIWNNASAINTNGSIVFSFFRPPHNVNRSLCFINIAKSTANDPITKNRHNPPKNIPTFLRERFINNPAICPT